MERVFVCDVCGRTFETKRGLSGHRHVHDDVEMVACPRCGKMCKGEGGLSRHLGNHKAREQSAGALFVCDVCGRTCATKRGLGIHKATHSEDSVGEFVCPECGKMYSRKMSLASHSKTHGYRPMTCEICGKEVMGASGLGSHIRRVHDERWREENLDRIMAATRTPEARAKHSESQKRVWNKPGYRENFSQKMSEHWADPEYKQRVSAKLSAVQTPEHRRMMSEKLTELYRDNDELRAKVGAGVSKAFSTPEMREMLSENSKRMWRNMTDEERAELCAKISEGTKASWQRPEVQENHRKGWLRFFNNMTDEERARFLEHNKFGIQSEEPNKSGGLVHCDSTYEARFCHAMMNDPNVLDFSRFIGSIEYDLDGDIHHYVPDFDVTLVDGRRLIIEIKADNTIDDEVVQTKAAAADEWCREHGIAYIIFADYGLMNYEMETTVGLDPIMWSFDQSPDAPAN